MLVGLPYSVEITCCEPVTPFPQDGYDSSRNDLETDARVKQSIYRNPKGCFICDCEFKCVPCAKISVVAANLFHHTSNKHIKLKVFEFF